MLTTAAGTLKPASVLIIGAGVAGLQAVATARRLGARVAVYDTDASTREQVESLGAEMINSGISAEEEDSATTEQTDAEEQQGEEQQQPDGEEQQQPDGEEQQQAEERAEEQQQTDELADHLARTDVVISTVDIAGKPAPKIITEAMVEAMAPGSVIVDLASESGGNCELTEAGTTIIHNGVVVDGPLNLASEAAIHASEMYAHNLLGLLELVVEDETVKINREDEVVDSTLLTFEGELVHKATADLLSGSTPDEPQEDQ